MAEEEEDFSAISEKWTNLVDSRFDGKIATAFKTTLDNLFDETEAFIEDLEQGGWDDSAFMDELHSDAAGFEDPKFCATFFKVIKAIVNGEIKDDDDANIFVPKDLNWSSQDDEKKIAEAQKYMNIQCPAAGFQDGQKNKNLLKAIAVGRSNDIPLMSLFIDMFELSHIDQVLNKRNQFKTETEWVQKCRFFKDYKPKDIIRRGMTEFKHRLAGAGLQEIIVNRIEDDVNIYIEYILMMNNIIKNLIDTNKECCPLQIDVVILGKEHSDKKEEEEKDNNDNNDDDDDDDEDAMMAKIQASMNQMNVAELANPLPSNGMAAFFKSKDIKFSADKISIKQEAKTTRIIQESINKQLGNKRNQRIIVIVDRTKHNGCNDDELSDMLYVYQLSGFDEIRKDYNEEHMGWMTKRQIFPEWKDGNGGGLNLYKGGGDDIGDNGFVFSFHIHTENKINCEQYIKSQRLPFLQHHMIELWPIFFAPKYKEIDKKYDKKYIYNQWKLPTKDKMLMKWIKIVDPEYHKILKEEHFKFIDEQ